MAKSPKAKTKLAILIACSLFCSCSNLSKGQMQLGPETDNSLSSEETHLDGQGGDDISKSFYGEEHTSTEQGLGRPPSAQQAAQKGASDGIAIKKLEVTENASFYPIAIEGVRMEAIAVKASDGSIRAAFNASQSCYASGKGYYEQRGTSLECQNCGSLFQMDMVGMPSVGCSPWPIAPKDIIETESSIFIPKSFLRQYKEIFANWGKQAL